MALLQRQLLEDLRGRHHETHTHIMNAVRPLDGARLVQRPDPNSWSVGVVLEHLCVTDEAYASRLSAAVGAERRDAGAPAREWTPTFLGGMLAKFLAKPRRMPAPKTFQPGPSPRNGIVEAFVAKQHAALTAMDDAATLDWNAVRVGSPAVPSWVPKMNLGDVFVVRAVHLERHAKQIDRIVAVLTSQQ